MYLADVRCRADRQRTLDMQEHSAEATAGRVSTSDTVILWDIAFTRAIAYVEYCKFELEEPALLALTKISSPGSLDQGDALFLNGSVHSDPLSDLSATTHIVAPSLLVVMGSSRSNLQELSLTEQTTVVSQHTIVVVSLLTKSLSQHDEG